jgi:hypothetical protein
LELCDKRDTIYTRGESLRLQILLSRQNVTRKERSNVLKLAVQNIEDCQEQLGLDHRQTLIATEELAGLCFRFG